VPESHTYGIESFVYRARRPFHPAKFRAFLNEEWPGVVRGKGHFWLATRPDWVGEMSQAGSQVTSQALGRWWAAIPKARWPQDNPAFEGLLNRHWDAQWGDRRQELVFIGIGMDEAALRRRLDACLVPEQRFQPKIWSKLPDPFPVWGERQAA
jgi:G3E family GTPase